jgi:hypothetical protein
MRQVAVVLMLVIALPSTVYAVEPFVVSLENAKVGELPQGWTAAKTGEGPGSVWKVLEDKDGKKVLAQTSDQGPNGLFNVCIAENTSFTDIDLTVAFKAVAGKLDQGGGPVWRYKDANNYYVARMNPLEDNYRVYKVVAGKRTQLASADVKAPAGEWHVLRVVQKSNHIQCFLDGKLYLDVTDNTFKERGKIGLWTKADAQTFFVDLQVKSAIAGGRTGAKLTFDIYSGYFVSNKFEPDAAASFVVISDQEQFDNVFGVAFVMRDKSHRLPKDAFKASIVVAAIKRGNAVVEYKVESATETKGVVELKYTTTSQKSDTATFACPLIVSIPKGDYKTVQFVESGKVMKRVAVGKK